MTDHCECCGVKFDGEVTESTDLFNEKNENYKWSKNNLNYCHGRICYWCACELPGDLVCVAIKIIVDRYIEDEIYNYDNFKTFPRLSKRIEKLGLIVQEEDNSKWNCECRICGAKAYQGLMRVECSKGCE